LCGVDVTARAGWTLVGVLFAAGAAGSPLHCVPMCGGFVLGQVADRLARLPATHLCEWRRVSGAALVPYHLGRLTTYAILGALAGLSGGVLAQLPWLGGLSGTLLLGAAVLFLGQALRRLAPTLVRWVPSSGGRRRRAPGTLLRAVHRVDRTRPAGGYLLGGALGMAAFGLGTAPALVVAGLPDRPRGAISPAG
jgi:sulfite exporter TauE/SafE